MAFAAQSDVEHFADGALVIANQNVTHAMSLLPALAAAAAVASSLEQFAVWAKRCPATGRLQLCSRGNMPQPQNKFAALPEFGASPHFAFVRLHNLIDDGQTQSGAALEFGLEWLEDFLYQLRPHSGSGVRKDDLPIVVFRL